MTITCMLFLKLRSHIDVWGKIIGNLAHLLLGYKATLAFKGTSPRSLTFVGITIQKAARMVLESAPDNISDPRWDINLLPDVGPLRRDGKLTVEGDGTLEAGRLLIRARSLYVQHGGLISLNGKGFRAGKELVLLLLLLSFSLLLSLSLSLSLLLLYFIIVTVTVIPLPLSLLLLLLLP